MSLTNDEWASVRRNSADTPEEERVASQHHSSRLILCGAMCHNPKNRFHNPKKSISVTFKLTRQYWRSLSYLKCMIVNVNDSDVECG